MNRLVFTAISLFCIGIVNAQVSKDSLENLLKSSDLTARKRIDVLNQLAHQIISSDIGRAKALVKEAEQLSAKEQYEYGARYSTLVKGGIFLQEGNYDSCKYVIRTVLPYLRENEYLEDLSKAYSNLGIAYKRSGDLDSANYYYRLSAPFIKDEYSLGRLMINIGSNYISQGRLDSAAKYQLDAISIFEKLNNSEGLTIAFLNLGNIFYKQDDFEQALTYYRSSLTHALIADHKPVQSRNYLNIGAILSIRNMNDSALFYFRKSIPVFEKAHDQTGLTAAYRSIGEIFFQERRLDSAEFYFLKCKALAEKTNHGENRIRASKYLTELYIERAQYVKALQYASESVELARELKSTHELQKSLGLKRQVLEKTRQFEQAYSTLLEEKILGDSIFKTERVAQISELQTQYETEKKDREIENLSQQAQIQALELNQRNTQLIGAAILVVVLILGGTVIIQRRNFEHRQSVTDMEQKLLRLQMNPHFIFNALASIQTYILQSNTKESVSYLSRFAKLMRQILEHSREEFITVKEEVDMLRNYIEIQQLRFRERFDYQIEIDSDIDTEASRIPPLFAQPFIENAIEHGFKEKEAGGLLTIRFLKGVNSIQLHVIDNGVGIAGETAGKAHRSMATIITRERLQLLSKRFRQAFSLEVDSKEDEGTVARLSLPVFG